MQAGNEDVVCAVMAAGNANDHRRTIGERPLVDAVIAGEVRRIDLLRLTVGGAAGARTRYAHSYIGGARRCTSRAFTRDWRREARM